MNFKNYGIVDYAKLLANLAAAFGTGFATGGYVGAVVTTLATFGALMQAPPGHDAVAK